MSLSLPPIKINLRITHYIPVFLFAILGYSVTVRAQFKYPSAKSSARWADSLLQTMRFEDMFAQKLMIPVWTRDAQISKSVIEAVEKHHVGGVIFFQGTPQTHVMAVNYLQQQSPIPLLISMDAEWGPAMRLDHVSKYPYPFTISSKQDIHYAFEIGKSQAKMLRMLGVHLNFAPVVDINTNAQNPIIGFRSFGDQGPFIADMALAFNKGLESEGVMGCAKHFPGHGNTTTDSHLELPEVTHDKKSLRRDIMPFQKLIDHGVKTVMMGHLKVPFLDDRPQMPASLSRPIVTDLLRKKLDFEGLIITDAMNMKGVSSHYKADEAVLKAVQAGNDILCFVENVPEVMALCRSWLDSCWIDSLEIAQSARRILIAKHQTFVAQSLDPSEIQELLDQEYVRFLRTFSRIRSDIYVPFDTKTELDIEAASELICLLDPKKIGNLPWKPLERDTLYAVIFGDKIPERLTLRLQSYHHTQFIWAQTFAQADSLLHYMSTLNGKFLFFNAAQRMWGNQSRQLPKMLLHVLQEFPRSKNAVFLHTGNPYALNGFLAEMPCLLGLETGEPYVLACVDALFGKRGIKGNLAADIDSVWNREHRTVTKAWAKDLIWNDPEGLGFHPTAGALLEAIMDSIIRSGASQSAQLLVLKDGKIAFDISRGTLSENPLMKVGKHTVYDVASITKIAAMTAAVMHVYEKEGIDLNSSIKEYWPEAETYPWGDIKIHQFLSHRSGLPAFLPLAHMLRSDSAIMDAVMKDSLGNGTIWGASSEVTQRISDSVWSWIARTTPKEAPLKHVDAPFVYSDLNAIILGKWIAFKTGVSLSALCDSLFYKPMGLFRTGFKPVEKGIPMFVMPTEMDVEGGRGVIKGNVHDPSAFLLGEVSGNAGLFSSAYDISRFMLMLLNGGELDQVRYFKKETVERFTRRQSPEHHRGLGFDKPNGFPNRNATPDVKSSNIFDDAPLSIFGHSGFTGTWAWADPDQKLVFIFLSNRTYPKDKQNLLAKNGYRGKLMEAIYQSLKRRD